MFRPWLCVLVVFSVQTGWIAVLGRPGGACTTTCVPQDQCPAAQMLLLKPENTPKDVQLLRNAFCGFITATRVMICCDQLLDDSNLDKSLAAAKTPSDEILPPEDPDLEVHEALRLLPEQCGSIAAERIFGGNVTGIYEFPWMVQISMNTREGRRFQCGGSLISNRYVLTAAHCVVGRILAGVRIGEHDTRTANDCEGTEPPFTCESHLQDVRIAEEIPHQEYSKTSRTNDIALLRLKKQVDFSYKNARPVCLPVTTELRRRRISGLNGTVAGWGNTETKQYSEKLLKVDVPIFTTKACDDHYNGENVPFWSRIPTSDKRCAGAKGRDSCAGDSGGPLVVEGKHNGLWRYIQYGVVSAGPLYCGDESPGLYTNVALHMRWILDNIKP